MEILQIQPLVQTLTQEGGGLGVGMTACKVDCAVSRNYCEIGFPLHTEGAATCVTALPKISSSMDWASFQEFSVLFP
jgi:hypothetical protein